MSMYSAILISDLVGSVLSTSPEEQEKKYQSLCTHVSVSTHNLAWISVAYVSRSEQIVFKSFISYFVYELSMFSEFHQYL